MLNSILSHQSTQNENRVTHYETSPINNSLNNIDVGNNNSVPEHYSNHSRENVGSDTDTLQEGEEAQDDS